MSGQATATRTLWAVDNGRLSVSLHRGQGRAWRSRKRFVWILAGSQAGKTSFGPLWLYREIQEQGPGDYLAVTSTFPLLRLKMLPEFLRLFDQTLHLGEWRASDRIFAFHDGQTRVIFGSATHPESLESATAKAAWLDEVGQDDFRLESWEAIQRRLSLHQGRVLGGTTIYNLGWLKQQVYEPWRRGSPDHDVIQFASTENPLFPAAEFERARRVLPAWKFAMFYEGQYDTPAGLIYRDFVDRYRSEGAGGHKIREAEWQRLVKPEWPRHGGLDFGAVNTAKLAVAHDPNANVFYVYRESLSGGVATPEHAATLTEWMAGVNWQTWTGGSKSETQQRLDYTIAGVPVLPPVVTDVEAGIDRVIGLLRTQRLFVVDTCRGLLDEMGTYSREVDADGETTEAIKDKAKFHRLDALRYVAQRLVLPEWNTAPAPYGFDVQITGDEDDDGVDDLAQELGFVNQKLFVGAKRYGH